VFAITVIVLASGCATARRQYVPSVQTAPTYQQQGYGQQASPYSYSEYGYGGAQVPPAMFVSEYAGSTYDPRTHGAVVRAEMMRETARRSAMVSAPPLPGGVGCVNCASRDDLGAVMDEVDALREEVDGR